MWTSARQTAYIDEISVRVRLRCGRVLSRGEIVSAIVEAVMRNECEFGDAQDEADIGRIALASFREEGPPEV